MERYSLIRLERKTLLGVPIFLVSSKLSTFKLVLSVSLWNLSRLEVYSKFVCLNLADIYKTIGY